MGGEERARELIPKAFRPGLVATTSPRTVLASSCLCMSQWKKVLQDTGAPTSSTKLVQASVLKASHECSEQPQ